MGWMEDTNRRIAVSPVGRWFKLEGCGHVSASSNV
jgi:AGZA family xanthine/uracil permease-like MFS transporter